MKTIANTIANRINLTLALAEALEGIEFTQKQFDEVKTELSMMAAQEQGIDRWLYSRCVPHSIKPFSLKGLREDGIIKVVRQETFTREIECPVYVVIHLNDLCNNTEEWKPVFRGGSVVECEDYRWNVLRDKHRQFTTCFYDEETRPVEMKRNIYAIDKEALEALVARMIEKMSE